MNEKWFNYAIVLTIIMFGINAFLTIGATQTGLNGQPIPLLSGLQNNNLSYSKVKTDSNYQLGVQIDGTSSQTPTNDQGKIAFTTPGGLPGGFGALNMVVIMTFGVELIMLELANIFVVIAPLFWAIAAVAFALNTLVYAYLATLIARAFWGLVT